MASLFDNPSAFEPFFDSKVVLSGVRSSGSFSASYSACVIDEGYDETFSEDDGATGSRIRKLSVQIPMRGEGAWRDDDNPPQIGDSVTIEHGAVFAVSSVSKSGGDFYVLEARGK